MYTQEITVNNEVGLHARPATFFIQKANEFKSGIWVEKEERRVNAKSLLGVLSLGIVKGTTITLIADGNDEKEAVQALAELVQHNFDESVYVGKGGSCRGPPFFIRILKGILFFDPVFQENAGMFSEGAAESGSHLH